MIKLFIKDDKIKSYNVENGIVYATVKIGNSWVSNPTLDDFYASGWADYTIPTPAETLPTIEELVEQKIRERYSINQEFEVLRKRNTDKEAFDAYYTYVEECIAWANTQQHQ